MEFIRKIEKFKVGILYEVYYVDHATRTIEEKGDEDGSQFLDHPVVIHQPCKYLREWIDKYNIHHSTFELEITTRGNEKTTHELDLLTFGIIDSIEYKKMEEK